MKKEGRHAVYMARAIELARKAAGRTAPNPMVGAVIVKNGRVIGEGYHQKAGGPHAEIAALSACKTSPEGATLYVTLEPCNHQGRTGPCAEAIIRAGIGAVVIGARDRSPKKGMKGARRLTGAGVAVTSGVEKGACEELVADFHKLATTGMPYVILKTAMTLDGKVATRTGDSKWITSPAARRLVHEMRREADGVMVGVKTVLADDPELTARHGKNKKQPIRIVVDSRLRTPVNSRLAETLDKAPLLIATTRAAPKAKVARWQKMGAEVVALPAKGGRVNLAALLKELGRRGMMRLFVEGGSLLAGSLLDGKLVDRSLFFIAPRLFGGGYPALDGRGVAKASSAYPLDDLSHRQVGPDFLIEGKVRYD